MSDEDVLTAIEEMERRLRSKRRSLDPISIHEWQVRFQAAVATAERGKAWARIVRKAQIVQGILEQTLMQLVADREAAKVGSIIHASRCHAMRFHRPGRS